MSKEHLRFPSFFADAESNYKDAEFVLFGIPFDKTSSFRYGSAQGPDAIRHASWNFESFDLQTGIDFRDLSVHDYGNIDGIADVSPDQMVEMVTDLSQRFFTDGKKPIGIGGEHSGSIGIVHSLPADSYVLIFDAHLDFRESYEDQCFNHACTIKRIADKIPIEQIKVLGVRSAEKNEYKLACQHQLEFSTSHEIRTKGMNHILESIKKGVDNHPLYLSIDIDVIDPGFAPGTGTPEPFGLDPLSICTAFDVLYDQIIGFDVMEVNPQFDHGQTAMLAARYIRYGIEKMSKIKH